VQSVRCYIRFQRRIQAGIQISLQTLADLIVDTDGIFDDEMEWPYEAQQKKTVGRLHYDVEK
jgi:hypothetical protein